MIHIFKIILIYIITAIIPVSGFSLEQLSDHEMKTSTAQAGITVALNDNEIYNSIEFIRLTNTEDLASFIEFQDIESTMNINCGASDLDSDGLMGAILIDIFTVKDVASPVNGQSFIYISADDLDLDWDISIGNINICGTGGDLGALKIDNITLPQFHLYAGAHGCGADIEFGFRSRIGSLVFDFNPAATPVEAGKLTVTGLTFAGYFEGTDNDPLSWVAKEEFTIGNINENKPVTFDVAAGDTVDPDISDFDHIAISTSSVQGSIRIENIDFGGADMGVVIMDNINVQRLDIEVPGRGLGRP